MTKLPGFMTRIPTEPPFSLKRYFPRLTHSPPFSDWLTVTVFSPPAWLRAAGTAGTISCPRRRDPCASHRRGAGRNSAFRHDWYKVRHGNAGTGKRAEPQLPAPHVKLIAMQPVTQRDRARHRPRRQALRDNRRLLRRAPAPPPRRSRQNLNPPETVPINWQITWQTSLPASLKQGRIIRSPSVPARRGQRSAYPFPFSPFRLRIAGKHHRAGLVV